MDTTRQKFVVDPIDDTILFMEVDRKTDLLEEILRLEKNGDIFFRGSFTTRDKKLYGDLICLFVLSGS